MKRVVAVLISILLVITTMPINVFAEFVTGVSGTYGVLSYRITSNEVIITACDEEATGEIVVPSTINDFPVVLIDSQAFQNCTEITSIIIKDGVFQIYNLAFARCVALRRVLIPKSVNSISSSAFAYCTGIEEFIVDSENTYYSSIENTLVDVRTKTLVASTKERIIPSSEQIEKVGSYALSGAISKTDIYMPINITYINYSAIDEWDTLETVWFQGTEDEKPTINTSYDSNNLSTKEWLYEKCGISLEHSYLNACDNSCEICEYNRTAPHVYDNNCDTDCNECEYVREFNGHDYNNLCDADCNSCGYIRTVPDHYYSNICDTTCNWCGLKRDVPPHVYDNACDTQCNNCDYIRSVPAHKYEDVCDVTCNECGYIRENIHVYDNDCDEICNNCDFTREVPEHSYGTDLTCDICKYSQKPDIPCADAITADSITLQSVIGCEYSLDMENWQSSTIFTELKPNTTYTFYQRVAESENSYVSEISEGLTVTTKKGYTITYDANGGTNAPNSQIKTEGVKLELSAQKPSRSEYKFIGWATSSDGAVIYNAGDSYSIDSDIVLYAKWRKLCENCNGDGKAYVSCSRCGGDGKVYNDIGDCRDCNGVGIWCQRCQAPSGPFTIGMRSCSMCGSTDFYFCGECGGSGNLLTEVSCSYCNSGMVEGNCAICEGTGTVKELYKIEITQLPESLTFLEGKDVFSVTGGKITLYYDDGTSQMMDMIPSMVTGFDNTLVGAQTLTVTYNGKTDTYNIEIIAKALESIAITTLPNKTHYLVDKDSFSAEGGKVTLYYNNDTSDVIDLNISMVSGFSNQTVGVKTLTVTYKGKTDTFNITVDEKTLTSISVTVKPNKLSYLEGDNFSKTGLVVTAYYDNDTSAAVSNYSISGYSATPGTKTITVTYNGKSDTFTVTVLAKSLSSIAVTTKPSKLTYTEGKAFDKSGMVVTAYYNNNTSGVVTDYSVSGYTSTPGTKTITVTYGGKNATFTVTVKSGVPQSVTSSKFTISVNKISKISAGTTVSALLNGISEGAYCKVYSGNSVVSSNSNVGTGMVVKIMDGNTVKASYTVIVTGDTNGDGNITVTDMIAIKAHVLKKSTLSGVYATAADTNGDSGISITDFIQVKAKILGKGSITAR